MRQPVERISRAEANRYLALGEIGLDGHYLGAFEDAPGAIYLANRERDAIAVYRCPLARPFAQHLHGVMECARLWRAAPLWRVPADFSLPTR